MRIGIVPTDVAMRGNVRRFLSARARVHARQHGRLHDCMQRRKVISTMPSTIELVKVSNFLPRFYEFADYARLVEAAARIDSRTLTLVLLGGDAGLRRGEMIGLRWCDTDMRRRLITVQQAVWKGIVDTPKSGRGRVIP
jgi:integrase